MVDTAMRDESELEPFSTPATSDGVSQLNPRNYSAK